MLAGVDPEQGHAHRLASGDAHLVGRHHLFTTVAHLAAAANPLLLPVARAVDYTVERWADERAAAITGARSRSVSLAWAGPVPRRVAALLAPPPRRQLALLAIIAILILTAGASAAEAARDLHALLELAQAAR